MASLHTHGQGAFAARIVHEAARTRSVDDVTALALALLNTDPTHALLIEEDD
ncbi:hypothetical protein OG851_40615 [Streptomyces sp. NBC_00161]|uniref:hypothetical protein n=1 Tax=Streptomyces sp. NBC_00161 TaxID=2975671 RepID=UPI0032434A4B